MNRLNDIKKFNICRPVLFDVTSLQIIVNFMLYQKLNCIKVKYCILLRKIFKSIVAQIAFLKYFRFERTEILLTQWRTGQNVKIWSIMVGILLKQIVLLNLVREFCEYKRARVGVSSPIQIKIMIRTDGMSHEKTKR